MKTYDELRALIEQRGVHEQLGPTGEGWGIEQSPFELATFLVRMQELGVQSCLEIGTGYKGGLSRFIAAEMGWRVASIDVRDYEHLYPGVTYWILTPDNALVRTNGQGAFRMTMKAFLKTYHFDLVFIDGAHDYDSVKVDYETYSKLATKAIAFHDIAGLRECEGAQRFWEEVKHYSFPYYGGRYFTPNWNRTFADDHQAGIGWIELRD